jgi:hypothetical protein
LAFAGRTEENHEKHQSSIRIVGIRAFHEYELEMLLLEEYDGWG